MSESRMQAGKWGTIFEDAFPFDHNKMREQLALCNKTCTSCSNTLTANGIAKPWDLLKIGLITRLRYSL